MNTHRICRIPVVALAMSLLALCSIRADQPNIILIMADDLGYGELGCYGQEKIKTPHLDQLAKNGMRFTQHYTSAPVCAPARCSLMTGMHGGHAYVRDNFEVGSWDSYRGQAPLLKGTQTIASLLKSKGYRTGAFGKWGLGEVGSTGDPLHQGFDRFFGYNCQRHAHNYYPRYLVDDQKKRELEGNDRGVKGKQYAPQLIADELLRFIDDNKDGPFFVYYPTVIPHLALQVPDEELEQYEGQWTETPYTGKSYQPHPKPRAAYAAMITYMDKQVGRIMARLEKHGVADNTLIIFTSDNGASFLKGQVDFKFFNSVRQFRGLKGSVYEGGIRVPMVASWPGKIKAGAVSSHISAHYDTLATLAEVAGAEVKSKTDGISYLHELLGKEQRQHRFLVWDFAGYGGQLAIRHGEWKAVRRGLKKNPDNPIELYHLEDDPGESNNVAADHPELVKQLNELMIQSRTKPAIKIFEFAEYGDEK